MREWGVPAVLTTERAQGRVDVTAAPSGGSSER